MKQAICIVTWSGGEKQTRNLLRSLKDYHRYPIYVVLNDSKHAKGSFLGWLQTNVNLIMAGDDYYECGALSAMTMLTDIDEFVLLQDTMEIQNPSFFDRMFWDFQGQTVAYGWNFSHFFGKWRREVLLHADIPKTVTKEQALLAEVDFPNHYKTLERNEIPLLYEEFRDSNPNNRWEKKWGRLNLVLTSEHVIKYKGTWGIDVTPPSITV